MGSTFRIPVIGLDGPRELFEALEHHRIRSWAAASDGEVRLCDAEASATEPLAVVVGSEAFGLDPAAAARATDRVRIPMPEGVDSFSVHAAAAIFLYELQQRRGRTTAGPCPPTLGNGRSGC
jgi:TrmH family RNA methyltransferase